VQQFVVGTAGHVDHGKTVLIGALTGEETDRLPEEKKRGISIDLGFAEFVLPSGRRVGVVDVPGHERFIKNMVAGVTGIDLVIMVVAADEGVMPQTREHLDILDLLGVENGIVAITKTDLVEEEWLELVRDDIAAALVGTFLEGAPVVAVSALNGTGLDDLVSELDAALETVRGRDDRGFARLPIDRVFTVSGFGTVVTGTLVSGTLSMNDHLEALPADRRARVRGLQVHGEDVEQAHAGQRVAVNLGGVDVEDVARGDVLLTPRTLRPTMSFAGSLRVLSRVDRPVKNNERVRLHTGTSEILGRVLLLDRAVLYPGEETYIQFKAEKPLLVGRGDRFIVRTYSPMRTIAGGEILDTRRRFRRFNESHLAELRVRQRGELDDLVLLHIERQGPMPVSLKEMVDRLAVPAGDIREVVSDLVNRGEVVALGNGLYMSGEGCDALIRKVRAELDDYHQANPLRTGMPREELRQAVAGGTDAREFQVVLEFVAGTGAVTVSREYVLKKGFSPVLTATQQQHVEALLQALRDNPYSPPDAIDFLTARGVDPPEAGELIGYLRERGHIVRVAEDLYFARSAVEDILDRLRRWFEQHETITVSELRDMLATTRKYSVPLLEYFDQERITRRVGDKRVLRIQGP